MGILFTTHMGFLLTITLGILFTIVLGIQFTISKKRQEETKIKRETHNSEANANHKSSLVGRKGSVATFLGKRPIIMTPAIILEEYLGAFKIELPDARIIHIPRDRFVFE